MVRLTIPLAFALAIATPAVAQDAAKCELDQPVVFAGLDYDSAQFHAAVAKYIVKAGYGCEVDEIPGTVIPLINGVSRGDADIIMEIWTANPAEAWVDAEKAGTVVPLGTTFPDAVEGWFVPTSLVSGPEAKAPDLKTVDDLKKYKELFADPEEPGKGRFYNCPAGWVCEVVNTKKLAAYGLDGDYTNFRPGTGEALASAAEAAALRSKPAVFYYWGPTWLLGKYEFTRLEEPAFDKAVWDEMMASDKPAKATAYPVSQVIIGANKKFTEEAPMLTTFLNAYTSTNDATSSALAYMRDHKASADEAAQDFLKNNEETWAKWVPADVAERVKSALSAS
jgi:glycine betaine/proline transport system substrate-binding protein